MYGHTNPTIRTTEENEPVGPRMMKMLRYVQAQEVVASRNVAAKARGPNGSQKYGYNAINRCIKRGLICRPDPKHPEANPHGSGAIYLTEKGEQFLANHE